MANAMPDTGGGAGGTGAITNPDAYFSGPAYEQRYKDWYDQTGGNWAWYTPWLQYVDPSIQQYVDPNSMGWNEYLDSHNENHFLDASGNEHSLANPAWSAALKAAQAAHPDATAAPAVGYNPHGVNQFGENPALGPDPYGFYGDPHGYFGDPWVPGEQRSSAVAHGNAQNPAAAAPAQDTSSVNTLVSPNSNFPSFLSGTLPSTPTTMPKSTVFGTAKPSGILDHLIARRLLNGRNQRAGTLT